MNKIHKNPITTEFTPLGIALISGVAILVLLGIGLVVFLMHPVIPFN